MMTQHRIVGSDAGLPAAHILVRHGTRRRGRVLSFAARQVLGWLGGVVVASLMDALIGAPVCFVIIAALYVRWAWFSGE